MKTVIKPGDFVILTGSNNEKLPDGIYKTYNGDSIYLYINGWLYKNNGDYCGNSKLLENNVFIPIYIFHLT